MSDEDDPDRAPGETGRGDRSVREDRMVSSEAEVIRAALMEFVRHNLVGLLERFMRDDIEWALRQKEPAA